MRRDRIAGARYDHWDRRCALLGGHRGRITARHDQIDMIGDKFVSKRRQKFQLARGGLDVEGQIGSENIAAISECARYRRFKKPGVPRRSDEETNLENF